LRSCALPLLGRPAGWLALNGVPEPSPSLWDWSTTPSSVRSSPEVSVIEWNVST